MFKTELPVLGYRCVIEGLANELNMDHIYLLIKPYRYFETRLPKEIDYNGRRAAEVFYENASSSFEIKKLLHEKSFNGISSSFFLSKNYLIFIFNKNSII